MHQHGHLPRRRGLTGPVSADGSPRRTCHLGVQRYWWSLRSVDAALSATGGRIATGTRQMAQPCRPGARLDTHRPALATAGRVRGRTGRIDGYQSRRGRCGRPNGHDPVQVVAQPLRFGRSRECQSPAGLASTSRPHGRVPVARRSRESVTATARQSASETVCKPSPVPPLARRRRSSIWDRGCPRPRAADPRTRRRRPVHARPRAPCRSSYLALHQVELARFTRSGTASRPDRFVTVALVLASRRTGVTRYPASGSSDFPRDRQVALQVPRPSDRLAGMRSLARRADATPAIGVVDLRTAASCRPAAARPSRRRAAAVGRVAASSRRSSRGTPFDRTAPARRTPHPPAGRLSAQPRHRWADHHVVGPLLRKRPLLGSPPRVRDGGATPDRGQRRTEDNAGPRTTPRSPPTRCTSPRTGRPPIVPMTKWRVLVPQTAFGSNGTGT